MSKEQPLTEMMTKCHHQLDEIFLLHQESLLQGQLENAVCILDAYMACHGVHLKFEDDVLLPKYESLLKQGRWNATLYQQEHQKIQNLHIKIETKLKWLKQQTLTPSQLRRNIIQLLDREKSFKGLCEHHQEREEVSLFIELDKQTDLAWREKNIEAFSQQWQQILDLEMDGIREFV
jgi:hemerythrin-like domain-containing protein